MKEISVIIPTYKPQDYLWQCLESLERQTVSKTLYEVVIILNGCKEPYYSNISNHLKDYTMDVRLLQTDEAGVSYARNIGIENAQGKYVTFVDDDDWVSLDYLSELYRCAPTNHGIVAANVKAIDDATKAEHSDYLSDVLSRLHMLHTTSMFKAHRLLSSACCKLIPKALIAETRFCTSLKRGEDPLWMAKISKRIHTVTFTSPTAVYFRRLRVNSASRKSLSYSTIFKEMATLQHHFIATYLSDMRHYNLLLFCHRVLAVAKDAIQRCFFAA